MPHECKNIVEDVEQSTMVRTEYFKDLVTAGES